MEQGKGAPREVWVREPKALRSFLDNDARRLTGEEIKLAIFHLTKFIRAFHWEAEA